MSFTYEEQKNILGNARTGIGKLAASIVDDIENGKDTSFKDCKLAYIFHIVDTLCRFVPVGEEIDGHTRTEEDNNITQKEADTLLETLIQLCPSAC